MRIMNQRQRVAVTLLLTFAALAHTAAGSVEAIELYRVVSAYYYAIGENRLQEAMGFYHEDSPQTIEVRRELEFGRLAYLQRTSTLSFDLVDHDGERAVVMATHRHLRIAGIKFMEDLAETRYVLRRQGDAWKIWSSVDRPSRYRHQSLLDRPIAERAPAGSSQR